MDNQQGLPPVPPQPLSDNERPPIVLPTPAKQPFPILWLVLWLAAWPIAFGLSLLGRVIFGDVPPLFNIFTILLGLYGLLGWIPFVIILILNGNKQK